MKKLLIGILALTSLSSFADEFLEKEMFGLPYYKEISPQQLVWSNEFEILDEPDSAVQSQFQRCGAISLINFNRKKNQKALLVSADHCLGDHYINKMKPEINEVYTDHYFYQYDANSTRIIYRSYENDLLIIEIDRTYAELEEKGIYAYEVASPDYKVDEPVTMRDEFSIGDRRMNHCNIKGMIEEYKTDTKDLIVTDCKGIHGSSGIPLIRLGTREIIGVVHGGLSINYDIREGSFLLIAPLAKAQNCFNEDGEIELFSEKCTLAR